jgi:hypothetical protein
MDSALRRKSGQEILGALAFLRSAVPLAERLQANRAFYFLSELLRGTLKLASSRCVRLARPRLSGVDEVLATPIVGFCLCQFLVGASATLGGCKHSVLRPCNALSYQMIGTSLVKIGQSAANLWLLLFSASLARRSRSRQFSACLRSPSARFALAARAAAARSRSCARRDPTHWFADLFFPSQNNLTPLRQINAPFPYHEDSWEEVCCLIRINGPGNFS